MCYGATKLARKTIGLLTNDNTIMIQDSITIGIARVSTINSSLYNIVYITNNYNYITLLSLHKHTHIGQHIITYIAISIHTVQLLHAVS